MRKAQYDLSRKAMYYILVIFVIAAMFIYLANSFDKYRKKSIEHADDLANLIAVTKVVYCLSYEDGNGKIHTGVLDQDKFTKEKLTSCLEKDELFKGAAIKVALEKETIKTIEEDGTKKYDTFYKYVLSPGKEVKKLKIEVAQIEKEE